MKGRTSALLAALIIALSGCATPPEPEPAPEVEIEPDVAPAAKVPQAPTAPPVVTKPRAVERTPPPGISESRTSEVETLLAEFERLRRLPAAELLREQELARQAFITSKSDAARVKWAMASAVPGASPADELRALELLDPLVRHPGSPLHGLAFLLSSAVQEQRRLSALVQGLQQNVHGLQQNNQALQQSVHSLQQKLEALRTLERSLTERGESPPRRR